MRALGRLAVAGIICGSTALGLATAAQATAQPARALNGNAHLIHVGLNPAGCASSPGTKSGQVNVHSSANLSRQLVNVSVRGGVPNTTYAVDIQCTGQIGSLTTDASGRATAHISLASTLPVGSSFFIDVSVPGGGAGAGGYGDTFIAGPFTLGAKK